MPTHPDSAAFSRPVSELPGARNYAKEQAGLSKLEYFTAAALTGLLAADTDSVGTYEQTARAAVKQARAVVAELNAEATT